MDLSVRRLIYNLFILPGTSSLSHTMITVAVAFYERGAVTNVTSIFSKGAEREGG